MSMSYDCMGEQHQSKTLTTKQVRYLAGSAVVGDCGTCRDVGAMALGSVGIW